MLITNLDRNVHAVLTARAAAQGQSLEQFLTAEFTQMAAQPTLAELSAELEQRPPIN